RWGPSSGPIRTSPHSSARPCRWKCRRETVDDGATLRAGGVRRRPAMARRIRPDRCWGAVIDVQDFFLAQLGNRMLRTKIESNLMSFARLLGYFRIPLIATLERPVVRKGRMPERLKRLGEQAELFEKDFFDLTKEKKIRDYLARLKRKQAIIAGCETD